MSIKHGWLTNLGEKVYAISHAAVIIYKDTTVQATLEKLEAQSGSSDSGTVNVPILTSLSDINCTYDSLLNNIASNMPQNTILFIELVTGALLTEIQEKTSSNQRGTLIIVSNTTRKQFLFLDDDSNIYQCTYLNSTFNDWSNLGDITSTNINISQIPFPDSITGLGVSTLEEAINKMVESIQQNKTSISSLNSNIEQLQTELQGKAKKSLVKSITLVPSNWEGNSVPFSYTISEQGINENTNLEIIPSKTINKEQLDSFIDANIIGGEQAENQYILLAFGEKPSIDIPLSVIIRGDS